MKQSVLRQLTNLNSLLAVAEGLLLLEPREGLEMTPAENPASTCHLALIRSSQSFAARKKIRAHTGTLESHMGDFRVSSLCKVIILRLLKCC